MSDEKVYAHGAARRAVQEHLDRTSLGRHVRAGARPVYHQRIRYALPDPRPHVTIIIPTRDRADVLSRCVSSVSSRSTYGHFDIVIVDNGSTEAETQAYFERAAAAIRVSRCLRDDEPFNFSRLNNLAAARARGAVLCFLNNDVEVISPDWLEEMVSLAVRPGVGAVGAMLYYPDDTIQHAGVVLGMGGVAAHAHRHCPRGMPGHFGRAGLTQAMSAVTAAAR